MKSRRRHSEPDISPLPMLVYQLATLLEAGRAPQMIWAEALRAQTPPAVGSAAVEHRSTSAEAPGAQILHVLRAADRAAALGHSVASVLRSYGRAPSDERGSRAAGHRAVRRVCADLADCWDVAESTGAPLAKLLNRYAAALEAELDAEAARHSALAGPRATVKLLNWLPVLGLGLGMLMGVDPVAVLFGTPAGQGALIAGVALMIAGRFWSRAMVAAAERDG